MRFASSTLVLGATSAALAQEQQVLGGNSFSDSIRKPLDHIGEAFGEMPAAAKGLWDEMSLLVPGFYEKAANLVSYPKAHQRRPDSQWDHVVKGADVQSMWVETDGVKHRKVDGSLEAYNLRAKTVDPSELGVDKVKQYSGYLDDEANDKHLFYCKSSFNTISSMTLSNFLFKGSSNLETTPRMTPSSYG